MRNRQGQSEGRSVANPKASSTSSEWYTTERNTQALVKAVMQFRSPRSLSGEDIWQLVRLTWVTASDGKLVEHHWQQPKVPALAHLLKKTAVPPGGNGSGHSYDWPPPQRFRRAFSRTSHYRAMVHQ
jgi:hypothetical protein